MWFLMPMAGTGGANSVADELLWLKKGRYPMYLQATRMFLETTKSSDMDHFLEVGLVAAAGTVLLLMVVSSVLSIAIAPQPRKATKWTWIVAAVAFPGLGGLAWMVCGRTAESATADEARAAVGGHR